MPTETPQRILIVEDEKPMANALVLKLNHEGFQAEAAFNGEEALQKLEQADFHLIVMDLVMPTMDGFTTLAEMKKRGITVPVIIASNLSQEDDEKRARELGAVDFFVKSNVSIADIVQHCKAQLAKT